MIDGRQIRSARERAGLTQAQLAGLVGVTLRTVGNWERGETVPQNREALIRQVLAGQLGDRGASLVEASDAELLAEIARRFSRAQHQEVEHGRQSAPTSPVTPLRPEPVSDPDASLYLAADDRDPREEQEGRDN